MKRESGIKILLNISVAAAAIAAAFVTNPPFLQADQSAESEVHFKPGKISLGGTKLKVELAKTHEEQARGLMFRRELDEATGMLFIYPDEGIRSFWMKNTFVPLSIGFFDKERRLLQVTDMAAVKSEMEVNLPTYKSRAPAMYALEVRQGWFERHKIKIGTRFEFVK